MTDDLEGTEGLGDGNPYLRAIEATVERAVARARSHDQRLIRVQWAISLILAVTVGLSVYGVLANRDLVSRVQENSSTLRQQSITNCENNDAFRAAQVAIWEKNYALQAQESKATSGLLTELISTLANNDPGRIRQIDAILAQSGKASANEIAQFLNAVKAADAPKDCTRLYAAPAG